MEYEDVFQEASLAFAMALKTYDESKGITFSAYMGRAVVNNLGHWARKLTQERAEIGMYINSELVERSADELADETPTPEEERITAASVQTLLSQFRPLTREILKELIDPSEEFKAAHEGLRAHREHAIKLGVRTWSIPDHITFSSLVKILRLSENEKRAVKDEIYEVLKVRVRC